MDKKTSKSERTQQFIIEKTAPVFNKKGFAGTSLSDLTEATGLTKGSIYGNFGNKEAVALAAFDHNHARISGLVQQKIAAATTWKEKLMVYAWVYDQSSRNGFPSGGCPILNTAVEADDTDGPLRERAVRAIQRWKKNILHLVAEGIKAGEFKETIDAERFAFSLIALIEGGIMISKVMQQPQALDRVCETVDALISGLQQ